MPTYEYACGACAHQWEEIQRITAAPTEICPKCGKPAAHRLISAGTNFILKGGGWYSDLYASPKPPGTGGGDKPTDAKLSSAASEPKSGEGAKSGEGGSASSKPAETGSTTAPTTSASKPSTAA